MIDRSIARAACGPALVLPPLGVGAPPATAAEQTSSFPIGVDPCEHPTGQPRTGGELGGHVSLAAAGRGDDLDLLGERNPDATPFDQTAEFEFTR